MRSLYISFISSIVNPVKNNHVHQLSITQLHMFLTPVTKSNYLFRHFTKLFSTRLRNNFQILDKEDIDQSLLVDNRKDVLFHKSEIIYKKPFQLVTQHNVCPSCGSHFQYENENKPGFLPKEKFEHIQELNTLSCQRCFHLKNFGEVSNHLRPGYTDDFKPMKISSILQSIPKYSLVLVFLDIFDFDSSMIPYIRNYPEVLIVVNKIDLLPSTFKKYRIITWLHNHMKIYGIARKSIFLVSCHNGYGISNLLSQIHSSTRDCYLIGNANVGKSSFLNFLLKNKKSITTSTLPGTTLQFLFVIMGSGYKIVDTPGVLKTDSITYFLSCQDLKLILPKKRIQPITICVPEGKCILLGGLAQIDVMKCEKKPFVYTLYISNHVSFHQTSSLKAQEYHKRKSGKLLVPSLNSQLIPMKSQEIDIIGTGWKQVTTDIVFCGLGWIALTGLGNVKISLKYPIGVSVTTRKPLMPFDIWDNYAEYTGERVLMKNNRKILQKHKKRKK